MSKPTLIHGWDELSKVPPSDTHQIIIEDPNDCCGWIEPLHEERTYNNSHYLSTHTFYGKTHEHSTKILQSCGFNVVIDNWDK